MTRKPKSSRYDIFYLFRPISNLHVCAQERLKREQMAANKTREGYEDADEEDDQPGLSKDGKRFKKMLRNRDDNEAYDSEEEENPYASSVWYFSDSSAVYLLMDFIARGGGG